MLDTNIIAYAKNNRPEIVLEKFRHHFPDEICISSITMAELEYGVCNSSKPNQNRMALFAFLSGIEIMPFEGNAAREYGTIRADLKAKGNMIGSNDLLIAAHAISLDLTLVTNNTKEFERVPGLKLENWV